MGEVRGGVLPYFILLQPRSSYFAAFSSDVVWHHPPYTRKLQLPLGQRQRCGVRKRPTFAAQGGASGKMCQLDGVFSRACQSECQSGLANSQVSHQTIHMCNLSTMHLRNRACFVFFFPLRHVYVSRSGFHYESGTGEETEDRRRARGRGRAS